MYRGFHGLFSYSYFQRITFNRQMVFFSKKKLIKTQEQTKNVKLTIKYSRKKTEVEIPQTETLLASDLFEQLKELWELKQPTKDNQFVFLKDRSKEVIPFTSDLAGIFQNKGGTLTLKKQKQDSKSVSSKENYKKTKAKQKKAKQSAPSENIEFDDNNIIKEDERIDEKKHYSHQLLK